MDGDALLSGDEEKPGKSAGKTFAVDLLCDTVGVAQLGVMYLIKFVRTFWMEGFARSVSSHK